MKNLRLFECPPPWLAVVCVVLAVGCSSPDEGGGGAAESSEGEGEATVCTDTDVIACHQICLNGGLQGRQCDFDPGCETAADVNAACGDGDECEDGLCVPSDQCAEDGDCPTVDVDGVDHIQVCVLDGSRLVCAPGCRNDTACRPADATLPWLCQDPELDPTARRCKACGCQTDVDCQDFGEAGNVYACSPGRALNGAVVEQCQCGEVECRPGFADCDDGEVCNPAAYRCESQTCRVHEDCADPAKHCKRAPGDATGTCVCPDERNTGACPEQPQGCRSTAQCQELLGATFVCLDWTCQEQPCAGDDDCDVLGTACGPDEICIPQPCTDDEQCPRRRDIVPRPSGVFWCEGAPQPGVCAIGCRDDSDCDDTHKCAQHTCIERSCAGAADCARGRWCNPDAVGAPDNAGLCEEGCDELADCPQGQPCRLDRHACGCVLDADCAIINPDLVCNVDGTCGAACRGHDDCAGDEACIDGHCFEGACRNDAYEANDNRADAFPFLRDNCNGDNLGCLLPCEDDPGNLCGTFIPRFCSEPPPHPDLTPDVAEWFKLPLNRFDEVQIEVVWPLVDTDGDGWGDAPGACDLDRSDLSGTTSLFRPAEDDPNGLAREWPRPQWVFEPPGPNQPCRMTVDTHVPAPRDQDYWLSIENLAATRFDYGIEVKLLAALQCEPDPWENNDVHGDARGIFDCAAFIIQGGHLGALDDVGTATFCENDSDWYELSLRPGDRVSVRATYDNRLGELRARLRPPADIVDPAVNLILEDVVGRDGLLELVEDDEQDSVADGRYLLEITQGSQANLGIPVQLEYDLEIGCEGPAVPCQDDGAPLSWEPNDALASAYCIYERDVDDDGDLDCAPIPDNNGRPTVWRRPAQDGDVPLHVCATGEAPDGRDEDWYRFIVGDGGQVNVLMENDLGPGGTWFLEVELQDAQGEVIRSSRNADSVNSFNQVGLAQGSYYIRVKHPDRILDERTVPYELTITVFGAPPECPEDGYEENDSFETARDLGDVAIREDGELRCFPLDDSHLALCSPPPGQGHDEEDWYKVDLTGTVAERIDVKLHCRGEDGDDLFMELRGEDGLLSCPRNIPPDRACRDLSPGCSDGERPQSMRLLQPRAEEQHIRVFGINDAQNEYDLCVGVIAEVCEDDIYENNDVCVQATVHDAEDSPYLNQFFPLDGRICPGDDDYYVFRPSQAPGVQQADRYSVRVLVSMDGDADLDVQLLDKDCDHLDRDSVLQQDLGLSQEVCLIHDPPAAPAPGNADADFFVRVYGADVLGDAGYTIKVDVGPRGSLGCI